MKSPREYLALITAFGASLLGRKTQPKLFDLDAVAQPTVLYQENSLIRQKTGRLTPKQRGELQQKMHEEKPDPITYEFIADEKSQEYAQRMAELRELDPRNDAANASDRLEINIQRKKALRRAIGLNPNRKE